MTVRGKILAANLGALAVVVALVHVIATTILTDGFRQVERDSTKQHTQRVIDALGEEERNICRADWAAWDDTYRYVVDKNKDYVSSNLINDAFRSMDVQLIGFYDTSGHPVWVRWLGPDSNKQASVPPELASHLVCDSFFFKHKDPHSLKTGLLALSNSTLAIASRPIVKSDYTGASRGTFVVARVLSPARIKRLSEQVHLGVQIANVAASTASPTGKNGQPQLGESATIIIAPQSDDEVMGSTILEDVYGKPVVQLKVSTTRSIYRQGQQTMKSLVNGVLAVAAFFVFLCLLLTERLVLSRLVKIAGDVSEVTNSGDLTRRVRPLGTDELGKVAKAVNEMLDGAETADAVVRASEAKARSANDMYATAAQRFQELFQGLPVACFSYDAEGIIHEWNRASEVLWGIPAHEAAFKPINDVIDCLDRDATLRYTRRVFSGEPVADAEWKATSRDGREMWLFTVTIPLLDMKGDITGAMSTTLDITPRKMAELALAERNTQLGELAATDSLTRLANQRAFRQRLDSAWASAERNCRPLSVVLLDVDHFKLYNDSFGHPEGDKVLVEVGKALLESVRPSDLVARYGGEEFVLLLPETDAETAYGVAERCRQAIEAHGWNLRSVTASFGVATWSQGPISPADLVELADRAMYSSKENGRNRVSQAKPTVRH
jgi:diguanylate cyclase (GGDEF)-like protein/PAS domain S-box-containing protein